MENFETFESTIIKLAKTYSIPYMGWQDIAQELRIHLWLKRNQYNPKRRYEDWAYITCRHKIVDLARYYDAKKRGGQGRTSINIEDVAKNE